MENKVFVTKSSLPPFEEYIEAIKPLWDTHIITNMGVYHKKLEEELRDYLKVPYVSLMVNGHMALEMAIQAFGFPEGSEVITTPFTFISTTHAIVRNGLIPVFCDVKSEDGTIDTSKIEELITEKTVAILPVHVYGNVCNMEEIQRIADKYRLKVIYDAAHAFGVEHDEKGIGSFGDASCFSFHATKVFNTIEGGAVTFKNPELYDRLYNLKNFGIRGEELVVDVGANAKMNEFCAIMGLCNLKHLSDNLTARKERVDYYHEKLADVKGLRFLSGVTDERNTSNYAYLSVLVEDNFKMGRNELYSLLYYNGYYSRKYFYPLTSDQACFKNKYKNTPLDTARELANHVLVLPLSPELEMYHIDRICSLITCL